MDAGIREQVLKCVVTVIHGWIFGDVDANPLGGGDIIFGFQVGLQAAPLNFLPPPPPIFDVEIIYADQTPPWNSVEIDFLGATLPTDWAAENVVDIVGDPIGVRFYTSTNPIEPGAPPLDFQNLFAGTFPDTDMDGDPDLPQELQIQVSNELGEIIGAEVLQIDYP